MADSNLSNLYFTSNLQPIGEEKYWDSDFLMKIRDPFALDFMQKNHYRMTSMQQIEHNNASKHCVHAFAGDYPWGTVTGPDGKEKLACRCMNMECSHFSSCNPGFQLMDLKDLIENEITSYLRYLDDSRYAKDLKQAGRRGRRDVDLKDLDNAYKKVLSVQEEEKPAVSAPAAEELSLDDAVQAVSVEKEAVEPQTVEISVPEITEAVSVVPPALAPVEAAKPSVLPGGFERFVHADYDDILNAGPQERMLVNAGPGTGKTWTLIHKIASLVENPDIEPNSVLVLSFSRAAVEEIEKRLKQMEREGKLSPRWHDIDFSTLDSFATRVILYVMKEEPELLPDGYSLTGQGYDARIETARMILKKDREILSQNIHVLIDEVQDLVGCRAKFVLNILHIIPQNCGFTVLGDACQSLYDYQKELDPSVMSSAEFYELLFNSFKDNIYYYRLDENHRQTEWLRDLITPYRDAILTGNAEDRRNIVYKIRSQILNSMINLNMPSMEKFGPLMKSGPVAILTRSNGEALKISELLKSAGIPHRLERPDSEEQMNDWIAAVFTRYPDETISQDLFISTVEKVQPDLRGASVVSCWNALTENVHEDTWYHVNRILESLLSRGKNRALFRSGFEESGLTVTNIHRAKGKEYDTVLIPAGSVDELIKDTKDQINEHKVFYVACTRPKKSLQTASLKKVFVSRDKNTGRCYEGSFKKSKKGQRYLSYIEVGLPGDIDTFSHADEKIQSYIRDYLKEGDRLILKKEISDGKVRYSIRPEEEQQVVLGYMSSVFSEEVGNICRHLSKWPGKYDPLYYPSDFENIVVTKKTTCIVTGEKKVAGIKYFGNSGIWFGFAVTGFAHAGYNRY